MRVVAGLLMLLAGCLSGCANSGAFAESRMSPGMSMDDVTNGLVNNSSRGLSDPATNPLAGAFFNDGGDGDVRGRTENYFGRIDDFGPADTPAESPAAEPPKQERMLIYRGQVRVEVARAEDAGKQFLAQVEEWGGYLQTQSGTTWTVRIPAAHFDEAFAAVRDMGRVLSEQREANDVTEEFVDLGIRVDNARRSRDRLLEVLKLADKVEDILKVEKELRRLTEEIERMEGRLKLLRDQVALATLRAEFQSTAEAPPVTRQRRYSRFDWINRVGAEVLMEAF